MSYSSAERMVSNRGVMYVFATGARTADTNRHQQLVTIDAPTDRGCKDSCDTHNGPAFLCPDEYGDHGVYTLPLPDYRNGTPYESARKMEFIWRSKQFVMSSITTFTVARVEHEGCVKFRLFVDGCCVYDNMLSTCGPFRLPPEAQGKVFEVEFYGDGRVIDFEMASSFEELARSGQQY